MWKKTKWTREQLDSVDWRAHKRAFLGRTEIQRVRLAKFIHWWNPIMQRLHIIDQGKYRSPTCNICNKETETQHHTYGCNHHASNKEQIKALRNIAKRSGSGRNKHVSGAYTYKGNALLDAVHSSSRDLQENLPVHFIFRESYYDSDSLRWDNLLRDRLSRK